MATTVHEAPRIEEQRERSRPLTSPGNGGGRNLAPAGGDRHRLKDYSPPPSSTGIWVGLAAISMTFAALTSALIVRQGSALDWRHLTLPGILYANTVVLLASSFTLELARRRDGGFRLVPQYHPLGCGPLLRRRLRQYQRRDPFLPRAARDP